MKTLTKREIIEETVKYYKTHKRAFRQGMFTQLCLYYTKYGSMCAVGRCLIDPKKAQEENEGNVDGFYDLEKLLKPKYRNHELKFWEDLQMFHDIKENWEEKGKGNILTSVGEKKYKNLIIKWNGKS